MFGENANWVVSHDKATPEVDMYVPVYSVRNGVKDKTDELKGSLYETGAHWTYFIVIGPPLGISYL